MSYTMSYTVTYLTLYKNPLYLANTPKIGF